MMAFLLAAQNGHTWRCILYNIFYVIFCVIV